MSKQELIDSLTRAMRTEAALAIEIGNVASTFPWSGLPDPARGTAMESLAQLEKGPARRARRLKVLLDHLQEGGASVH